MSWEQVVKRLGKSYILWAGIVGLPGPHYLELIVETDMHTYFDITITPMLNINANDAGVAITKGFQLTEKEISQAEALAMVQAREAIR